MPKIIVPLLLIILASNSYADTHERNQRLPDCDLTTSEVRASFILSCIKNANPHSDEEPEDWIKICQTMAEKTYCPYAEFTVIYNKGGWGEVSRVKIK